MFIKLLKRKHAGERFDLILLKIKEKISDRKTDYTVYG